MQQVWFIAALWLFLALVAVLAANWLRVSTALPEIVVGTLAQLAIGALAGAGALNAKTEWIAFLAGTGAIVLTFLAGAELDPAVFRRNGKSPWRLASPASSFRSSVRLWWRTMSWGGRGGPVGWRAWRSPPPLSPWSTP